MNEDPFHKYRTGMNLEGVKMMIESRTKQRTRQEIQQALIQLLETTSLEKITAVAVAKKANVNRSTFYAYYEDVYALINQMEEDILHMIRTKYQDLSQRIQSGNMELIYRLSFRLIETHGDALVAFLGPNGDHAFFLRLIEEIKPMFLSVIGQTEFTPELEIVVAYEASGVVGVFTQWYRSGKKQPLAQIVQILQKMLEAGVKTYI